jgi:cytochrome c biogenesis protein CcmG/thiol:disulfide interchange protein DsbE
MMKKSRVIKGLSLLVLILSLLAACSKEASSDRSIGKQKITTQDSPKEENWGNAPDFTLPRLGGSQLKLSSLKGKVIILDFWAPRCPPCRKEIPGFIELYKKYKDEGLEIVGVCLESEAMVKPFAKKMGINYVLVSGNREVCQQYGGIRYIPTTFIIDRQGNIAKKHIGYASKETFEREIKELLSRKAE